ncbi:MAG: YggT family protein [Anaerolineae bacterium]|nr:MAG: YggT family protein [Anaerolineae bacterium]
MVFFIARFIQVTVQVLVWLVIIDSLLSFFMAPFHPVRQTMDRIVEPLLAPVRRFMPQTGMIDLSPLVFILGVQLLGSLLINVLLRL